MNGYYQPLIQILKLAGFVYLRQGKGSHEMWGKGTILVTAPRDCDSRHTANAIMKQAGIDHRF
jgi:predicted RNA binding protein YcfA (HicA-like mRNA interferase family)